MVDQSEPPDSERHEQEADDELAMALRLRRLDEGSSIPPPSGTDEPSELDSPQHRQFLQAQRCLQRLQGACDEAENTPADGPETVIDPREQTALTFDGIVPRSLGKFEIIRELGRGGFGIVLLARDPKLDRQVALKIPRPEALISAEARVRFEREAMSAAILSHPAIVPIFETGHAGPVHYIAFAYCEGMTLAQWLQEAKPVPPRLAAEIVARLAEAVQHAHARGVIHRDLKPGNVLVRSAGADRSEESPLDGSSRGASTRSNSLVDGLQITDFGLAKLDSGAAPDLTRSTALIGTPAYMSPEQARGDGGQAGAPTDIFALGIILYELLTGRTPFKANSEMATLQAVLHSEPASPRRARNDIPRDLESICLKCLEKAPERRYLSAQQLADDLLAFLQGRPVVARPVSTLARASRWCQRNQLVATLSLATMLVLATGAALVTWQWLRAEQNLKLAREQRDRAEQNIARVERAVSQMVTNISDRLHFLPQLNSFRNELLRQAVDLQDELIKDADLADPASQLTAGKAQTEIAQLQRLLSDLAAAQATAADAIARLQTIRTGETDRFSLQMARGRAFFVASHIANEQRSFRDAERFSRQAIEYYRSIKGTAENETDRLVDLSIALAQLGMVLDNLGDRPAAETELIASLETLDSIESQESLGVNVLFRKSISLNSLAVVQKALGQLDQAAVNYQLSLAVVDQVIQLSPDHLDFINHKGSLHVNMGNLNLAERNYAEAGEHYGQAVVVYDQLCQNFPGVPRFLNLLSIALAGAGTSQFRTGDHESAETSMLRAIGIAEQLADVGFDEVMVNSRLGTAFTNLSNLYKRMDRLPEAAEAIGRAVELKRKLAASSLPAAATKFSLAVSIGNLGELLVRQGNFEQAVESLEEATQLTTAVIKDHPENPRHFDALSWQCSKLIYPLVRLGHYDRAIEIAERGAAAVPDQARNQIAIAEEICVCLKESSSGESDVLAANAGARLREVALARLERAGELDATLTEAARSSEAFQVLFDRD